jgi:hypothetical protein
MKLLDLYEASIATKNLKVALPKIISYLSKKLGVKLIRIPGVDHYQNSNGKGFGIRYVESGSTRAFRINWNTEGSLGQTANIHSIDIFNGKHDPSFTVFTRGISLAQALPALVTIAQSPTLGKHKMFPVSPQQAFSLEDEVVESVKLPIKKNSVNQAHIYDNYPEFEKDAKKHGYILKKSLDGKHTTARNSKFDAVGAWDHEENSGKLWVPIVKEHVISEAHRDDFTAEEALTDFLKQLSAGESFTRSSFIGRYHPINVGIFDTIMNDFSDRFIIDNRRISLASNTKLGSLKDAILSKAGIVEVTRGGTGEVYLKTAEESKIEKEVGEDRIPYEDTLEHLEGLVKALIKGSYNALFVAGKGGSVSGSTLINIGYDKNLNSIENLIDNNQISASGDSSSAT